VRALGRIASSGGAPVRLTPPEIDAGSPALSRAGNRLAFVNVFNDVNIWETAADGHGAPQMRISARLLNSSPQFSHDGKRIAFRSSRNGQDEVWVSDCEGRSGVRVTDTGGALTGAPRWSPDDRWIAFNTTMGGSPAIWVIQPDGGGLRQITAGPHQSVVPSWSRDGRSLYFASNRSGSWQVWKQPVDGTAAVQVTRIGGFAAYETADGQYLYYSKHDEPGGIWRIPLLKPGAAEEGPVLPLHPMMWGNWALGSAGIYRIDQNSKPGQVQYFDFKTGQIRKIADLTAPAAYGDGGLAVSPDERTILFCQVDRTGADIWYVENFR
jgi:Tol biopolymer transport system component